MRPTSGAVRGRPRWADAKKRSLIHAALGLVGVDRGDEQGEVGVAFDGDLALRGEAVDEGVVDVRASRTSGRSSTSSRNPLFVLPPSITTVVSSRARRRRTRASSRDGPHASVWATSIGPPGAITSPSATAASTRMPGPAPSRSRATRPGAGANPRSGSSALSRAWMATPRGVGWLAVEAAAEPDVQLQAHEVDAGRLLDEGVLGWQPRIDLEEAGWAAAGHVDERDRGDAAVADEWHQRRRRPAHGLDVAPG